MIAIIGPTASGKTSIGSFLVDSSNFSVINFDSCQFKRDLPVLKAVPDNLKEHYLYSVGNHDSNVCDWAELALNVSYEILLKKKRSPVLIGGTGLYLKCFFEGIDYLPKYSDFVKEMVENLSIDEVKKKLLKHDPRVLNIYKDERRQKKALTFFLSHKVSILSCYGKFKKNFWTEKHEILALLPQKQCIIENIEKRLLLSFDNMVKEVEFCTFSYLPIIGFCEIKKYLRGDISKIICIQLILKKTKEYAKRQITFIKNCLSVSKFFEKDEHLKDYLLSKHF